VRVGVGIEGACGGGDRGCVWVWGWGGDRRSVCSVATQRRGGGGVAMLPAALRESLPVLCYAEGSTASGAIALQVIRLARVLRLLKVTYRSPSFQLLLRTLKGAMFALFLLLVCE